MGRTPCCEKNGLKKGPWTPEEDQKLIDYIQKHGCGNWRTLPKNAGLQRCGKSCRLRWTNYLRPDIKRGRFSFEEEETIIHLHSILGNKWSAIAARLPGRTDNEIKNYWNTHIRKRLLRMGIDPVTHSLRLDLLDISSILTSSLYNSSQMSLQGFVGAQPLVNPELLRIATSIFPSQRETPNCFQQNVQESQLCISPQVQNQLPQLAHPNQFQTQIQEIPTSAKFSMPCALDTTTTATMTTILDTPCVPFSSEAPLIEPHIEPFSSTLNNFSSQNCHLNEWPSNGVASNLLQEDYVTLQNYAYYGSEDTTFQSNSGNFSYTSVLSTLSTPSSSPTPCINRSSSNEDERESYYHNNWLKFPDMLDVNRFM